MFIAFRIVEPGSKSQFIVNTIKSFKEAMIPAKKVNIFFSTEPQSCLVIYEDANIETELVYFNRLTNPSKPQL